MPKLLPELPQALKTRVKIIRADSKSAIRNWVCLVLGVILSGIPGTLSGSFPPPDTLHLFNGEDLSGWYTYLQESGKNNDPDGITRTFHRGRVNWYGRDAGWEDRLGFRGENDIEYPRDSRHHPFSMNSSLINR